MLEVELHGFYAGSMKLQEMQILIRLKREMDGGLEGQLHSRRCTSFATMKQRPCDVLGFLSFPRLFLLQTRGIGGSQDAPLPHRIQAKLLLICEMALPFNPAESHFS